jgi:hypothetical protein
LLELIEFEKVTIAFSFSPMLEQIVEKMKEKEYRLPCDGQTGNSCCK